ncbi:MAG TPA: hypothetical protein VIQ30_24435 [Pseudonocardia sp.]
MTMTEFHQQGDFPDHGTPVSPGERETGVPRRRRTLKTGWAEPLDTPHARRLVAGQLGIRVEQLRAQSDELHPGEAQANADMAELLDDLIDALRAV